MKEPTDKPGLGGLFRGRVRRAPADLPRHVPRHEHNGVDENIPPGIRLAGAWSWRLLAIAGAAAVLIFLIIQLRLIVIPLLVAVLVSALLVPFVSFLVRHRWPRGLSVALALLGTLAVVGGLIALAASQIAAGSSDLTQRFEASVEKLKAALLASPLQLTESQLNDYLDQANQAIQSDSQVFITGALSVGSSVGHLVAGFLLALFSLLFILIDGKGIWDWIVRIFPRRARAAVDGAGIAGWSTLGNFAKVQILVASIDAVGIGVGAALLGVPLAVPIGILVFLGSFIPIVGAVATGIVAVIIALLFNGPGYALAMLGVVLLVQQVEGHVLQPLIMGTAVKVHPLAVVLAVGAGSLLAGIPGALFAVPVAAVLNVMTNYIHSGVWRAVPPPAGDLLGSPLWQTVPRRPGFRRTENPE
ncbi:Predicted PurR-regulated permease PerM [Cryobacterium psychrotolerans]|uniref:Predicted PurR-regulated permease PerM n=1 Tax=Cryobacterium psychrotolerans TaxID=386301 RepID=A0A1G8XKZ6_9MICO|nr:AI-2E family transporter [Cryobacterium psychrotolerans]SDJ90854.1 Predicted PurR-regulated permease PerM [Cryobacterium psychrotolerans]